MSKEFISDKVWRDSEGTNYIMLDVTEQVPQLQPITIDGIELYPKNEYHVTLVPTTQLTLDAGEIEKIIDDVRQYLTGSIVEFIGLGKDYYHCQKDDEQTVIVSAKVAGLEGLQQIITRDYPNHQPAFAHVTLFKSRNSEYGIGVSSYAQLAERCRRIDYPF